MLSDGWYYVPGNWPIYRIKNGEHLVYLGPKALSCGKDIIRQGRPLTLDHFMSIIFNDINGDIMLQYGQKEFLKDALKELP